MWLSIEKTLKSWSFFIDDSLLHLARTLTYRLVAFAYFSAIVSFKGVNNVHVAMFSNKVS